jgi:hypothetical protein
VAKKPSKQPQPKAAPQFDADPIEDDEQPPFTLDDDGNMVLRRGAAKPAKGVGRAKNKTRKPAR